MQPPSSLSTLDSVRKEESGSPPCSLDPKPPSDNRLAGVNAYVDSCAISLFLLHLFNVDNIFPPLHLDYSASLLTFVVSSYNLNFVILRMGMDHT
ncbi:hypothetical protein P7K49_009290, partial [Saguinus oedipus]